MKTRDYIMGAKNTRRQTSPDEDYIDMHLSQGDAVTFFVGGREVTGRVIKSFGPITFLMDAGDGLYANDTRDGNAIQLFDSDRCPECGGYHLNFRKTRQ